MGIYFDFDVEGGKEVETWFPCYLCGDKNVLFVEYQVRNGPIYTLYKDARKLYSGRKLNVGSSSHLICDDCFKSYGSEDRVVAEVLRRRKADQESERVARSKQLDAEIQETRRQIDELVQRLAQLYHLLEEEQERTEKHASTATGTGG